MTARSSPSVEQRLDAFLFGPVDPLRLDLFQRGFAFSLLLWIGYKALHPYEWLTSAGFHYSAEAQLIWKPSPLPLLPEGPVVFVFLAVFGLALFAVMAGVRTRIALWIAWVCEVYVVGADVESAFTLDKLYTVGLLVLALAPSPVPVGPEGALRQSAWPLRILQATLLIQYFTAGWCKIAYGDWLQNGDVLWSQVQGVFRTDLAAWMLRTLPREAWTAFQYSSLGFELLGPFLFLSRRTVWLGILWGIGFHVVVAATMYLLFFFSFQMVLFYLLFLDPDLLRALGARERSDAPAPRHP